MNFVSVDIQGSILSTDLLGRIRSEQCDFQQGKDFLPGYTNAKLKDEISLAWQEAKGQWTIFKSKLARLKEGEPGTTETRNFWISPLLTNLGYNLSFNRQAEELGGKVFPIGYRDSNLDGFPVYVGGFHESLDKRPENKMLRVSPHAMLQEYLNYSEHLYGLVTNGRHLRLLRDASRITRLSYVEFDLEKMMEEDLYSDFVILYRVLHASRMPKEMVGGADSIIEKYHQQGLETGSTIRNKLGAAVKGTILKLANEFINHPHNEELRKVLSDGELDLEVYYRQQLRIVYRLLFLFVIEERNLVYADHKTPETKRFAQIYFNSYSLMRLRKLARKLPPPEANRHYDLWQGLVSTFSLFEDQAIGAKLGIMSLQGDLFGYGAISDMRYDLHECRLSNAVLLDIIQSLSYFENEKQVLIAVNYGGLDVEEFGSVYEGLLELKLKLEEVPGTEAHSITFDSSTERGSSGSHYTPEELVQPLIKHSLEYLIEDRVVPFREKKVSREATVDALLGLKICDVACGSGHILLSAARRVALEVARVQTDEEQPNPQSIRKAMKTVIRHCIYGVDKNPLAVELCKVALWLEAHNPGEPLNFLDHHIKCGDAIVGLAHRDELMRGIATEAFKALPGDDKEVASGLAKRNKKERDTRGQQVLDFEGKLKDGLDDALVAYRAFASLPEGTPEEIAAKAVAYERVRKNGALARLKDIADLQLSQFFIPKDVAHKNRLVTDATYFRILGGREGMEPLVAAEVMVESMRRRFFHWFLEFPEVFGAGGFDCILGNPPFLGSQKISKNFGKDYLEYIKFDFPNSEGIVDLVSFFLRRDFDVIKDQGYISVISTNTISQGDTRVASLAEIENMGGHIIFGISSCKWPGLAAVEVSLVGLRKKKATSIRYLNNKQTTYISSFLVEGSSKVEDPHDLSENLETAFVGSYPLGEGYLQTIEKAEGLIQIDPKYKDVLFPYLNGADLNSEFDSRPRRWVINFFDWAEEKAKRYDDCYKILEALVKPERQAWKKDKEGNDIVGTYAMRPPLPEKWWHYGEKRPKLYATISNLPRCLVIARTSKTCAFEFADTNWVLSANLTILAIDDLHSFGVLSSTLHSVWAWTYSTKFKTDLIYTPTTFESFPFPRVNVAIGSLPSVTAKTYHEHRRLLMLGMQLGLTKTYNLFHARGLRLLSAAEASLDDKAFEKQIGKEALSLRKHLAKTPEATLSFKEAVTGILELRRLHVEMDNAVAAAYGWEDIALRHDFYEVDYLPENDRVRYTIHPEARREVLKRLLALNHAIHAEEVANGLAAGKGAKGKGAATTTKKDLGDVEGQMDMFGESAAPTTPPATKRGPKRKFPTKEETEEIMKLLFLDEDDDAAGADTEKGGGV